MVVSMRADYLRSGVAMLSMSSNAWFSPPIAQVQDGEWKTVWPFSFTDTKILYPAPLQ